MWSLPQPYPTADPNLKEPRPTSHRCSPAWGAGGSPSADEGVEDVGPDREAVAGGAGQLDAQVHGEALAEGWCLPHGVVPATARLDAARRPLRSVSVGGCAIA